MLEEQTHFGLGLSDSIASWLGLGAGIFGLDALTPKSAVTAERPFQVEPCRKQSRQSPSDARESGNLDFLDLDVASCNPQRGEGAPRSRKTTVCVMLLGF